MTTENNDLAGAGSEIVAPEQTANEQPEVAKPEGNEAEQQPKEESKPDDSDKSLKRLQRRVDRVTAARYQAEAKAQQLEAELQRYRQQTQPEEGHQQHQFRPEDIDRLATERASEIAAAQEVTKRSNDTFNDGIKSFGEAFRESVAAVIDEAGPLITERGTPTALGEAILDSDKPAELLHYLGQNPDIADSLNGLSAARLGRRIEAIEREMKQSKVSKAPAPLEPVKPKGATAAKPDSQMSDAEWYAQRRKRS